ncbi:MAG TPA: hypothetical protein VHH73_03045, partial [Verrucomicrobiae bacterium]|nr:hypothetical protein [Verrucomicrobiae bacterium]
MALVSLMEAARCRKKSSEIDYYGIDICLTNKEAGVLFVTQFLEERCAPKGSVLEIGDERIPFGKIEAVAV